jgi:hypothetical protein
MIRLTVLYNLPPGADEAAFLEWRLGEHQQANASTPGVVHTDFGRIDGRISLEDGLVTSPYRFMTIADFEDRAVFEREILSAEAMVQLRKDAGTIADALFLISEILVTTRTDAL